jgi:hypothetical protein
MFSTEKEFLSLLHGSTGLKLTSVVDAKNLAGNL